MFRRYLKASIVIIVGVVSVSAAAADEGVSSLKQEPHKTYGGYASIGNPYPTLFGINGAYNVTPDLRASIGYGEIEVTTSYQFTSAGVEQKKVKAQTYAVGAEYLFLSWPVRPLAGLHLGYFNVSGDGDFSLNGFKKSTTHLYSNLGMDWIASNGYQLGAGMNVSLVGSSGASFYINTGYFF
jgi:hypothetical protein